MKDINNYLITESRGIELTPEECDCILRIMAECDFVNEMNRYNNDEVTNACVSAIQKMEKCAGTEDESILNEY